MVGALSGNVAREPVNEGKILQLHRYAFQTQILLTEVFLLKR